MRKVDKLGRIVIPQELRKKYGMTEGSDIEFIDTGESVALRAAEPFCKICRARLEEGSMLPICDRCADEIVEKHGERIK